ALAAERAGYVVAADLSVRRLGRVRENAGRLGPLRLGLVAADARRPPLRPLEGVLVDAPCTGTGTLRRHPDGKWRLTPRDLEALATLQAEILRGAAEVVQAGGVLVYATCSLEAEENETQVERFLEEHPEFRLESGPAPAAGTVDASGYLRVLPQAHGSDGAFAARMVRGG
ncbi:MAG TPA: RsmB/NOP family class I SAM-dependent RNA methyltransferase, partial [Longimicrobiales bacterium]|nr:RsmB/NOP family class I SAM-dependent RNA methyltransferase [Longimicrobiales bacterium]